MALRGDERGFRDATSYPARVRPPLASLVLLVLTASGSAHAADGTPVFEGHPDLVVRTKEVATEGSFTRLGDGKVTLSGGFAVATFYKPWLSLLGAANFSPGIFGTRQHYDTRAVARLIYPEPIAGHLFVYVGPGVSVLFYEDPVDSETWRRAFGPVLAIGAFVQLFERFRIRLEARDHWMVVRGEGMRHNLFFTLSLVTLYR